jgi:YjbE family integral membrane protein
VVIDLVLSGDNAVVIGMAAGRLEGKARRRAIIFGAGGAVLLRVIFTAMVAVLLGVPYLQMIGGLLLIWITIKLVRPPKAEHAHGVKAASGLWEAIRTIVMADVVMSLDNILAVGGSAHGDLRLLIFGLALSIPLITVGSGAVAWALDRWSWLNLVGGGVLAWTAAKMVLEDPVVHARLAGLPQLELYVPAALTIAAVAFGLVLRRQAGRPGPDDLVAETPDHPQPPRSSKAA